MPPLPKVKPNGTPISSSTISLSTTSSFEQELAYFDKQTVTHTLPLAPIPQTQYRHSHIPPRVMDSNPPSRPLSVAIPRPLGAQGPYCPRKPGLSDILANNAPPPWSLSAFMAYLSQNHCLETLEFTMDASRYRKHYNKLASRAPNGQLVVGSQDAVFVKNLWGKLVEAYIAPNGAREVNLPSFVRDDILAHSHDELAPHPSTLDTAVDKIHELMEDSVLVPFLNSFNSSHADANGDVAMSDAVDESAYAAASSRSYDERQYRRSPRMSKRSSPPLSGSPPASSSSYSPHQSSHFSPTHSHRISAPTSFGQFTSKFSSHNSRHSHTPTSTSDPVSSYQSHPSSTTTSARNSAAVLVSDSYSSLISPVNSKHNSTQHVSTLSHALLSQQSQHQQHQQAFLHPSLQALAAADSPADLTDAASSSPSALGEPMTPPTTPPMCDNAAFVASPIGLISQSGFDTSSQHQIGQSSVAWGSSVSGMSNFASNQGQSWSQSHGHHGSIGSNASVNSQNSNADKNGSSTWRKMRSSFGFGGKKRNDSREREESVR